MFVFSAAGLWLSAAARGLGDELIMTSGCCSLCPVLQKGAYWSNMFLV